MQSSKAKFTQLRDGLRVLLSSPHFLLLEESSGPLTEEQIATRLAFFLTTRPPDDRLLGAELSDAKILRAETQRLLASRGAESLVERLCDQWLQLSQINFTEPDSKLASGWNRHLQESSLEETRAYFGAMLHENLPVSDLIASDYTFANAVLAKHYSAGDLPPLNGTEMRKVKFQPDSLRGGLLTHASILKVSADGTTTSPIVRGVWMKRHLLDQPPPPPPPGIPGVEPDVRGATTIRAQIDLHKKSSSCASCHTHIDPYGLALESFDPIGKSRLAYSVLDEKAKFGVRDGPTVDPSGTLPDGRTFKDIRELRAHLLAEPDMLAQATLRKLIAYATGHAAGFADRPAIAAILDQTRGQGHRLQDLVHALIQSPLFLHR